MVDTKDARTTNSGIETSADGTTFIPSSKRPDGSIRKAIRVKPGYRPPEDVATYKNRSAEAWKSRGSGDVPGVESPVTVSASTESKNKNAKRREAARKKGQESEPSEDLIVSAMENHTLSDHDKTKQNWRNPDILASNETVAEQEEVERQRKIRNQLKKLRAVQELKTKRAEGERLSHDQLIKVGKETELLRDLKKLKYDGPEISEGMQVEETMAEGSAAPTDLG